MLCYTEELAPGVNNHERTITSDNNFESTVLQAGNPVLAGISGLHGALCRMIAQLVEKQHGKYEGKRQVKLMLMIPILTAAPWALGGQYTQSFFDKGKEQERVVGRNYCASSIAYD